MKIEQKIDKYLVNEKVSIFSKYYKTPDWHDEVGEVAGNAESLILHGKKSQAIKYLKGVIKKGVPYWHEEAVEAAEEILNKL